ncbi:MAG: 23S rRNA (pseudouridine(1915)-N(3))-methyltransferase RlmH [FCB group bacterium]|nr:23S rRNA (pseudouridine(1915)-N(3))-methyltransferase RlmH [FCB group bacterium]
MLSLHLIIVGRDKESWVSDQSDHYRKLLARYAKLEITVIPEERYGKGCDISKALAAEAKNIESRLKGGYLYILDIDGKSYDTKAFAAELTRQQNSGLSRLEFVIGGPYGLDQSFKDKKKGSRASALSLSDMTMSHQIIRLVLLEQLYRALNLNTGGSYHK